MIDASAGASNRSMVAAFVVLSSWSSQGKFWTIAGWMIGIAFARTLFQGSGSSLAHQDASGPLSSPERVATRGVVRNFGEGRACHYGGALLSLSLIACFQKCKHALSVGSNQRHLECKMASPGIRKSIAQDLHSKLCERAGGRS